jgi:hypothetical protein
MENFLLYLFLIHFFITPEDIAQENERTVERVETVKRTAETAEKHEEKEPDFRHCDSSNGTSPEPHIVRA